MTAGAFSTCQSTIYPHDHTDFRNNMLTSPCDDAPGSRIPNLCDIAGVGDADRAEVPPWRARGASLLLRHRRAMQGARPGSQFLSW